MDVVPRPSIPTGDVNVPLKETLSQVWTGHQWKRMSCWGGGGRGLIAMVPPWMPNQWSAWNGLTPLADQGPVILVWGGGGYFIKEGPTSQHCWLNLLSEQLEDWLSPWRNLGFKWNICAIGGGIPWKTGTTGIFAVNFSAKQHVIQGPCLQHVLHGCLFIFLHHNTALVVAALVASLTTSLNFLSAMTPYLSPTLIRFLINWTFCGRHS